jgi:hypothetical protein
MRDAHQGVPISALPGPPASGILPGLFSNNTPPPETSGMAPTPPAPIQSAGNTTTGRGASLDGWLLDNLLGRARN